MVVSLFYNRGNFTLDQEALEVPKHWKYTRKIYELQHYTVICT